MAGETILTIVGNLTADPELRTLSNGNPVASFTIASTPRTYNRQTQQYEDGAGVRPVGQRRQRLHAGHVRRRHRRPGILERTPSWQRKKTRTLSRTRSYPTK